MNFMQNEMNFAQNSLLLEECKKKDIACSNVAEMNATSFESIYEKEKLVDQEKYVNLDETKTSINTVVMVHHDSKGLQDTFNFSANLNFIYRFNALKICSKANKIHMKFSSF